MTTDHMQNLIADIQSAEDRAHRLGAHVTAHALNEAKNKAGWELANYLKDERKKVEVSNG